MADEGIQDLQELAIDVGEVRSACVLMQVVAEALETEEPGDRVRQMELHEGLGFVLGAVAERLRDIQRELSRE